MDEAIMDQYICKSPCAKARKVVISTWILLGFLITISYKSVLRANMMSTEYEKGIDSIEDMIISNKQLMVIRSMKPLFDTDPRTKVIELSKKVKYFDFKDNRMPQWILDGYSTYHNNMFIWFNLPYPCRTYVENEFVILGLGTRGNFGTYLPEGAYKSKKTNLFSGAAAFHLPTASPLKASNFPEIFLK